MSVFSLMFLRCLRVVSPEYFDKEIEKIYEIGKINHYPKEFFKQCFKKAKKTFYRDFQERIPFKLKNLISFPYNENLLPLIPLLKSLDISLIFYFKNNLKCTNKKQS